MAQTELPDMEKMKHVYDKWEKRVPPNMLSGSNQDRATKADNVVSAGRQRWRDKFGDDIKPVHHRRTREKPQRIKYESVSNIDTIASFKIRPTILPESHATARPFLGHCCSCLPISKKDIITDKTTLLGLRNILDLSSEDRKTGIFARQFQHIAYSLRRHTCHNYPDVSLAVLTSPRLKDAIRQKVDTNLSTKSVMSKADTNKMLLSHEKKAENILSLMKAKVSNLLIRFTGWFLFKFLGHLLHSVLVHKGQMEMVVEASKRGLPIIYIPLHRSHLDYILVTFILWNYDLSAPHIAAGDNLNIFLFSWLERGLGGFFIRRKLDKKNGKRDVVYRAVLHSYMQQLLCQGESMEFFVEGGRTRSGKASIPKGGLLSVVVEACMEGAIEDAYIVPVSINYERILDGNFNSEQMGARKVNESFFKAMKAIWNVLNSNYGSVRADFCQPFSIKEYIQTSQARRQTLPSSGQSGQQSPDSYSCSSSRNSSSSLYSLDVSEEQRGIVQSLGNHVVYSGVEATALMCTNLLAFLLLTKHREGGNFTDLKNNFNWLKSEIVLRNRDVGFTGETDEVINYAYQLLGKKVISRSRCNNNVDVYAPILKIPDVFELCYYSNTVHSVFALESLVMNAIFFVGDLNQTELSANCYDGAVIVSREEVLAVCQNLHSLLSLEFLFVPPCANFDELVLETIDQFVTSEMLRLQETQMSSGFTTTEHRWATHLTDSLSWANEDSDGEEGVDDQTFTINTERKDCVQKMCFLQQILAPILEAYWLTSTHIEETLQEETPETDFLKSLHTRAKNRANAGEATFVESAALDYYRNALKSFQHLRILDCYSMDKVLVINCRDGQDAKECRKHYHFILQSLNS